jgi:hypothetical protein
VGDVRGVHGVGLLLHTEAERVELGEHGGRRLAARVEHRTLRVAFGRGRGVSFVLGQRRAVSVEVRPAEEVDGDARAGASRLDGGRYDDGEVTAVAIPRPADPWPRAARRVAAVAVAGWVLTRLARRLARRERA